MQPTAALAHGGRRHLVLEPDDSYATWSAGESLNRTDLAGVNSDLPPITDAAQAEWSWGA